MLHWFLLYYNRSVGQKWFVDGKTSDENNKITIENNEIILSPVTHSIIVVVSKFVQSLYSHREYTWAREWENSKELFRGYSVRNWDFGGVWSLVMQRSAEVKRKVIVSEQNVDITENGARNLEWRGIFLVRS